MATNAENIVSCIVKRYNLFLKPEVHKHAKEFRIHVLQIVGTQQSSCYQFRKTKQYKGSNFHSKNQQDIVRIINAGTDYEDFKYPTLSKNSLDVTKVQLFLEFELVQH
eukprot:3286879-Rhodomonas_salina.6